MVLHTIPKAVNTFFKTVLTEEILLSKVLVNPCIKMILLLFLLISIKNKKDYPQKIKCDTKSISLPEITSFVGFYFINEHFE